MNILIISRQYYPVLGGVPVVADLLRRGLQQLGHDVTISSETLAEDGSGVDLVVRRPTIAHKLRMMHSADMIISIGVTIRSTWHAVFFKKPFVVSHQAGELRSSIKTTFLRSATNVACSQWLADKLAPLQATAVSNPYDDEKFKYLRDVKRDRHFVFCGRVTREKGIFDLLDATRRAVRDRPNLTVTIIGDGLALSEAKSFTNDHRLNDNLRFLGRLSHEEIALECNRHISGLVPSRWQEPFGITALELAACGLWVIGTRSGGLPEAIGAMGEIYEIGDNADLAKRMISSFDAGEELTKFNAKQRQAHLKQHTPKEIARRYLESAYL